MAREWSTTALGAPEQWSRSLRTALALCSQSPVPTLVWWGPQLALVYNQPASAALGPDPATLGQPGRDVWPALGELLDEVRRTAQPLRAAVQLRDRALAFTFTPIIDDAGGVEGIVGTCTNEAAAGARKDQLLALLGHELRNELAPLLLTISSLRLHGSSPELDTLDRQIRNIKRFVDDVLDASRIARGKLVLNLRRVELATIVDRAIESVAPALEQRGRRITTVVPREGLLVDGDADRLCHTLAGMLAHVARAPEAPGDITIDATLVDQNVRVAIHDRRGDLPGSGDLPIAIARGVLELHHGEVALDLTDGRTTTVTLTLPVQAAGLQLPSAVANSPRDRSRKRVLIVEDDDETAQRLAEALQHLGFTVALAHDGPVALSLARTFQPDVALLDIGLPVMDGYELAKRLRQRRQDIRCVAVTGLDSESHRERTAAEGFVEHVGKPVDFAKLGRIVDDLSTSDP